MFVKLLSLKRRESTTCNMEVTSLKKADAYGSIINPVTGLHRSTMSPYDSNHCNVDGAVVEVRSCLMQAFDREASFFNRVVVALLAL